MCCLSQYSQNKVKVSDVTADGLFSIEPSEKELSQLNFGLHSIYKEKTQNKYKYAYNFKYDYFQT